MMAKITVTNIPGDVAEILVYHSGKNNRTTTTDNITGRLNNKAIGKPFTSLLAKPDSISLFFSQYTINSFSFSVSIRQR